MSGAPGSEFGARLFGGETTSPEEWREQLREFHARLPGSGHPLLPRPNSCLTRTTMNDPLIDEARKAGQAYIDSFKGDLKAVCADLRNEPVQRAFRIEMIPRP